jgi:hypothetical protein
MHPDISRLVRSATYPLLQDAPKVSNHPPLRGVQKGHRVIFMDHDEAELRDQDQGWGQNAFQSKVNAHEVQMAAATVRYLIQQGYNPDQIVVLTPYLGQLLEIRREIMKDGKGLQVSLSERDVGDLYSAAQPQLLHGVASSVGTNGVRVSTIDNFQGEEADVVVASLVRSNEEGIVGFLSEPERINVLISRARHGLILIGSAATFRRAKNPEGRRHWSGLLTKLEETQSIMRGLPGVCQIHETKSLLDSPLSFLKNAPDGGCCLPCNQKMPCGHTCSLRCHAYDPSHESVRCNEIVQEFCSVGHLITRLCSSEDSQCPTCLQIQKIRDQEMKDLRKLEEDAARRRSDEAVEKAKLEKEIETQKRKLVELTESQAARKEEILLKLQAEKLRREVGIQKKQGMTELAAFEKEQRAKFEKEMQEEEEARRLVELDALARRQLEEEEENMRQEIQQREKEFKKMENDSQAGLQRIVNQRTRLEAETDEKLKDISQMSSASASEYRAVSKTIKMNDDRPDSPI